MKKRAEQKRRRRMIRAITNLNDRDFETVVFHLLGNEAEQELAYKILMDIAPECAVYGTVSVV